MSELTYEQYLALVVRAEAERYARVLEDLSEARATAERASLRCARVRSTIRTAA